MLPVRLRSNYLHEWFTVNTNNHRTSLEQLNCRLSRNLSCNIDEKDVPISLHGSTYMNLNSSDKVMLFAYNTYLNFNYAKIIKPLSVNQQTNTTINRITNIYPYFSKQNNRYSLTHVKDIKNNKYYIGCGAIFNDDLEALFLAGLSYGKSAIDGGLQVQREVLISDKVFTNSNNMIEKYIIKTLIPFLSSEIHSQHEISLIDDNHNYINEQGATDYDGTHFIPISAKIRITIDSIPTIIATPNVPSIDISDEALVQDIATNDILTLYNSIP